MGNIFNIIIRIFPFVVFVIFEIFSFYLMYKNNDFYESKFISHSNYVVSNFYQKVENTNSYFLLKENNDKLANENAALRAELLKFQEINSNFFDNSIADSNRKTLDKIPSNFNVISAKAINNSISNVRNYIIVNKGYADGVKKNMGVISDRGPVGKVVEVSENFSTIMSFLNKDGSISAKIKSSQNVGQLKWSERDYRLAYLEEIPRHIVLKKGDLIVTSGYSFYFPENIPIGRIHKVDKDKTYNFSSIEVSLFNDFSKLKYVYLIGNKTQDEIQTMNNTISKLQQNDEN